MEQASVSYLENTGRWKGMAAWFTSTDHKRIALLYLFSIMVFFIIGVLLGLLMRTELFFPGQQIISARTYNGVFSVHGIIMIFLVVIPGLSAIFGNFFLPIMIGAKDVAFPRLNLFTWYIYITGAVIAVDFIFTRSGPPDTGWTFYAPYSTQHRHKYCYGSYRCNCAWFFINTYRIEFYCYYTQDAGSGNDFV